MPQTETKGIAREKPAPKAHNIFSSVRRIDLVTSVKKIIGIYVLFSHSATCTYTQSCYFSDYTLYLIKDLLLGLSISTDQTLSESTWIC